MREWGMAGCLVHNSGNAWQCCGVPRLARLRCLPSPPRTQGAARPARRCVTPPARLRRLVEDFKATADEVASKGVETELALESPITFKQVGAACTPRPPCPPRPPRRAPCRLLCHPLAGRP